MSYRDRLLDESQVLVPLETRAFRSFGMAYWHFHTLRVVPIIEGTEAKAGRKEQRHGHGHGHTGRATGRAAEDRAGTGTGTG